MPLLRPVIILAFSFASLTVVCQAQEGAFPSDNEINLLLTQADRAMQQYKPLIDQEEELQLGKSGAEAVAKDREVVRAVEIALQALKKRPQGFNSAAGFALFEWLDDASRNAMVCSASSNTQATIALMDGDIGKATELIHLGQSCMDVSSLIYTVSENAGALYERYAKSAQKLAEDGAKAAEQCADTLKKMDAANKQKKQ